MLECLKDRNTAQLTSLRVPGGVNETRATLKAARDTKADQEVKCNIRWADKLVVKSRRNLWILWNWRSHRDQWVQRRCTTWPHADLKLGEFSTLIGQKGVDSLSTQAALTVAQVYVNAHGLTRYRFYSNRTHGILFICLKESPVSEVQL